MPDQSKPERLIPDEECLPKHFEDPPPPAARKKRSDADTKRESLFVYPSPAMRLDLQHAEARDMLAAWLRALVTDEPTAERVGSVMGELIAHIDRLRKSQK